MVRSSKYSRLVQYTLSNPCTYLSPPNYRAHPGSQEFRIAASSVVDVACSFKEAMDAIVLLLCDDWDIPQPRTQHLVNILAETSVHRLLLGRLVPPFLMHLANRLLQACVSFLSAVKVHTRFYPLLAHSVHGKTQQPKVQLNLVVLLLDTKNVHEV